MENEDTPQPLLLSLKNKECLWWHSACFSDHFLFFHPLPQWIMLPGALGSQAENLHVLAFLFPLFCVPSPASQVTQIIHKVWLSLPKCWLEVLLNYWWLFSILFTLTLAMIYNSTRPPELLTLNKRKSCEAKAGGFHLGELMQIGKKSCPCRVEQELCKMFTQTAPSSRWPETKHVEAFFSPILLLFLRNPMLR